MRLDASREFETFTTVVGNIKTHAVLLADVDVLTDLIGVLGTLVENMFKTLPSDVEKDVLRALLENKYDEILALHGLARIKPV